MRLTYQVRSGLATGQQTRHLSKALSISNYFPASALQMRQSMVFCGFQTIEGNRGRSNSESSCAGPACLQVAATSIGVDQTKARHASDSGRQDGWRKADSHTRHYDCVVRQASRGYARICQDQGVCISHAFAAKLRMLPLRLEQMTSRLQGNLHLAATNSKHRLAQGASLKTLPPSSVPLSLRPHLLPGPALILHSPSTLFLPCIIGMH